MRMENITESRFTDLHTEKALSKIFFPSWSKKPRGNQMAHIAFFTCEEPRIVLFQDCLLNQIPYKRWLRNLCGELCGIGSMQSKKRKRKQRVGLYQKSHRFAAHTCSISNTTISCVKYHTDRLSDWIVITALDSSSVYDVHNLSMEISPCKLEKML